MILINKNIEKIDELFSVFSNRLTKSTTLNEKELNAGNNILEIISNIKFEQFSLYTLHTYKNKIEYIQKTKIFIQEIIDEHEYRVDLEHDAKMVEKCLRRFNKMSNL